MNLLPAFAIKRSRQRMASATLVILAATSSLSYAATEEVSLKLGGKTLAHGKSLVVTNSKKTINPSLGYNYKITGTIKGKDGLLGQMFPQEIPVDEFLDGIKSGSSSLLSGSIPSDGNLPATLLSLPFEGGKNFKGIGRVTVKFKLGLTISDTGQVEFSVTSIKAKVGKKKASGKLRFGKGTKLVLSTTPVVQFARLLQNVDEADGKISITVLRRGNRDLEAGVTLTFQDITATAAADYDAIPISVVFAPGQTEQIVDIPIVDDLESEKFERFSIALSNPTGAFIGASNQMTIGIFDNE